MRTNWQLELFSIIANNNYGNSVLRPLLRTFLGIGFCWLSGPDGLSSPSGRLKRTALCRFGNVIPSLIMSMSNIDCANKTRSDRIPGPGGRESGGGLQSHSMQWMAFRVLLIYYL